MEEEFKITDEFLDELTGELIKPGSPFEVTTETIRGTDYKTFKRAFKNLRELYASSLEETGFVPELLEKWYGNYDRTFIVYGEERYSFDEIYRTAAKLSWQLQEQYRIKKGDRVVIAMRNYPEFCLSYMALTAIGAIAVPLNAWWEGQELDFGIRDSKARLIIADQERADRMEKTREELGIPMIIARPSGKLPDSAWDFKDILAGEDRNEFPPVDVHPDDDAYIMYTSGSTGNPKGVVATHRAIISAIAAWEFAVLGLAYLYPDLAESTKSEYKSSIILTVPLFHVTGLVAIFLACFRTKRKMVMMYRWDPDEALRLIEKEKITAFNGVPTMSWELVNSPEFDKSDISALVFVGGGGAARPPEHVKQLEKRLGRHISQAGYGLTETTALGATNAGDNYIQKPDSVGRTTSPIMEAKIVDTAGRTLESGETGEICFKSCSNLRCYWNNPEATADIFLDKGWILTGDIGYIDKDDYIFIKDRAKDLVIRGGENISCKEVEDALYEHPAVFEAAVFGIPDERLGEQLAAVIMVRPGEEVKIDELKEHTKKRLAKFKIPSVIWLQEEPLPRLATGKISKRSLKEEKSSS